LTRHSLKALLENSGKAATAAQVAAIRM